MQLRIDGQMCGNTEREETKIKQMESKRQRFNSGSVNAAKFLLIAVVQNQNKIGVGGKQGQEKEIREGWLQMVLSLLFPSLFP